LATNELNNTSNSSRRVGGEVVFFLRPRQAMSGLPMLSHRSLAMPPRPRSWSPHTLSTLMHAAQLPSSIIISHQHRAITRCKCNLPWPCACLYAHDQTRPSLFLLQICQVQCLCTTCRHAYKVKLFKNNWIASNY